MKHISTHPLPNLHADFTLAVIGPDYAQSIFNLMENVRANLPEEKKHYLKPLKLVELQQHALFNCVLGAVETKTGRLAGAFLITPFSNACNGPDKFAEYPVAYKRNDTAVIKIFVGEDFRKKGLMGSLLAGGEHLAYQRGFKDLIAKVDTGNQGSRTGFEKAKYEIVDTGIDPALGYDVEYWYKACNPLISPLASIAIPRLNGREHDNDQQATFSPESFSPV